VHANIYQQIVVIGLQECSFAVDQSSKQELKHQVEQYTSANAAKQSGQTQPNPHISMEDEDSSDDDRRKSHERATQRKFFSRSKGKTLRGHKDVFVNLLQVRFNQHLLPFFIFFFFSAFSFVNSCRADLSVSS
jgi:hypothetical protein